MKKTTICLTALALLGAALPQGGCARRDVDVISRIVTNEHGIAYLEVDGKPFAYYGVESRMDAYMNCEGQTVQMFEEQFIAAKNLGANVLSVPIDWYDLEPEKGIYDFETVGTVLSFSAKYDLKVEFLWYSVNMCGESNSYQVPAYIWQDEQTYPKFESLNKGNFWSYYGEQGYLKASDALLEREALVIGELMNYVYEWDAQHGGTHPLIGVQVYNEPESYPLWRVAQQKISEDGRQITPDRAWEELIRAMDNAGKAFKQAKYNVITRVNFAKLKEVPEFAERVFALEGIDCVGNDPYNDSVKTTYDVQRQFQEHLPGNFAHFAENKGSYANTASLLLASAQCGAGYIIYDLATPEHFIENRGTNTLEQIDHGVLNPDGTDKAHTESVRRTLKALVGAGDAVMLAPKEDFAVFNLKTSEPRREYSATISTTHVVAEFTTTAGAVGFVIVYDGYVYLFADAPATITPEGGTFSEFSYGTFRGGEWVGSAQEVQVQEGTVTLDQGLLCRARVDDLRGERVSDTKEHIGG